MAIQQHPVPQDISNYKFRLIGDMTIKQFASLGVSIVLSVIVYSSPLPFFFKYPISFVLLLVGVGMAFVPIQGRTLDVWIVAFIKSIYSPTQYIWKHGQAQPTPTENKTSTEQANNDTPQTPVVSINPPALDDNFVAPVPETPTEPIKKEIVATDNIVSQPLQEKTATPSPQETQNTTSSIPQDVTPLSQATSTPISAIQPEPETPTTTNQQDVQTLPVPFTPTTPNTLVGLTLTPEGKTLDGVLVEIKNQNLTLRATKSNKLGQFLFVRPLENGLYQILAEKDGFKFETYSIDLTGEIINPLRLQATT